MTTSIQLFQLKTSIDHTDVVWDVVTCESTQRDHFLCGPADLSYDEYLALLKNLGRKIMDEGRMNTKAYLLPFPSMGIKEGRPLGSFVKVYLGDSQVSRAQKEFDAMTYLGNQNCTFPTMITHKQFPAPRLLFQRILVLPLVLTTDELRTFCHEKVKFYEVHFKLRIDVSFAMPSSTSKLKIRYRNQVIEHYKKMAIQLLLRQQLSLCSFIHGDPVDSNIIHEDGANLTHRVTGRWPDPESMVGLQCVDSKGQVCLVHSPSWPTLVDYDTVLFPSANYFQNYDDYFCETPFILKAFYTYDLMREYIDNLSNEIIPLIRSTVVKMVTRQHSVCCIAYFTSREIINPFLPTDESSLSDAPSFHLLHSLEEKTEPQQIMLNTYLSQISSIMMSILRVFQETMEDDQLSIESLNKRIQHLHTILHCKPLVVKQAHLIEVKIK